MGIEHPYAVSGEVCSYETCRRPAWADCPDGRCLFHSPHNGSSQETARSVWQTARQMAADQEADRADFRGWHFPKDPDHDSGDPARGMEPKGAFVETVFVSHANFHDAKFSGIADFRRATFGGQAHFGGAAFARGAWFFGAKFSKAAWFDRATFGGEARFHGATFCDEARFGEATFGGLAWFTRTMFRGKASYDSASFDRDAWFGGATFSGMAWLSEVSFAGQAGFLGATFCRNAWFDDATFCGTALFGDATFSRLAVFDGAAFGGQAWFNGARCNPGATVSLDGPRRIHAKEDAGSEPPLKSPQHIVRRAWAWLYSHVIGRPHPFRLQREGETAYRLAKQAAQAVGDYTEAGRYHYAEQCAIEDRVRQKSGFWAFLAWLARLFFGRIVFGYGERPWHPLRACLAVIIACGVVYFFADAVAPGRLDDAVALGRPDEAAAVEAYRCDFFEALYFSAVTFTTLGYGDCAPKPAYRLLAASEAFLGAALLATFVVCLTRKYMR